jgi:hypothetical protein
VGPSEANAKEGGESPLRTVTKPLGPPRSGMYPRERTVKILSRERIWLGKPESQVGKYLIPEYVRGRLGDSRLRSLPPRSFRRGGNEIGAVR